MEIANSQDKLLFVHTTSSGCSPCQSIAKDFYKHETVAELYNTYFVNYTLNVDDYAYNNFAKMHDLGKNPALLYFNPNGYMVKKVVEVNSAEDLIETAYNLLKERTPENLETLGQLKEKYVFGYDDNEFLYKLAYLSKTFSEPYNATVNDYLNKLSVDEILSTKNRAFIYDFADNLENNAIDFFILDIHHYKEVVGGRQINDKVKMAIYNSIYTAVKESDEQLFQKALRVTDEAHLPNAEEFKYHISSEYFIGTKDWERYAKLNMKHFEEYNVTDPKQLNEVGEKFHMYVSKKKYLQKSLEWMEKSIGISSEYYNNLTYARLLRKLSRCNDAVTAAQKAIEIAEYRKVTSEEAARLIDNIKSRGCSNP